MFFNNSFFQNPAVYKIMWKNMVEATEKHMCIACWITKTTDTGSEYVILTALPWKQCLYKSTSMLCYMYMAYLA